MNYNISYFIKKFESIPERKWCSMTYSKRTFFGIKRDAIGFCMPKDLLKAFRIAKGSLSLTTDMLDKNAELRALIGIFGFVKTKEGVEQTIHLINDGYIEEYSKIKSPKQRILAHLYKLQAKKMIEDRKLKLKACMQNSIVIPTKETISDRFKEQREQILNN